MAADLKTADPAVVVEVAADLKTADPAVVVEMAADLTTADPAMADPAMTDPAAADLATDRRVVETEQPLSPQTRLVGVQSHLEGD